MRKLLVGATPNPEGWAAVRRAGEEARMDGSEVLLFDYVRVSATSDPFRRHDEAAENLRAQEAELTSLGLSVRTFQPLGIATLPEELIRTAEEEGADLIIIGIRRRSKVGKAVLGSAAQDVLLGASCPVLAVKAETSRHYPAAGPDAAQGTS